MFLHMSLVKGQREQGHDLLLLAHRPLSGRSSGCLFQQLLSCLAGCARPAEARGGGMCWGEGSSIVGDWFPRLAGPVFGRGSAWRAALGFSSVQAQRTWWAVLSE